MIPTENRMKDILWNRVLTYGDTEPYGHVPIPKIYEAADILAKEIAIGFFKFNATAVRGYVDYLMRARECPNEKLEEELNRYETSTLEERFQIYLNTLQP